MKDLKLLSNGNNKLVKDILCWSITPVKSCPNCRLCKDTCYAVRPYERWPNVRKAWDRNFSLAKQGRHVNPIVNQLMNTRAEVVRIHVSGDFFSQKYIDSWVNISRLFPQIKFYSYSKTMDKFNFSELATLPNVNIINSICPDGKNNYGDEKRINMLHKKWGYFVCPAVTDRSVKCGLHCKMCQLTDKVCFLEHK